MQLRKSEVRNLPLLVAFLAVLLFAIIQRFDQVIEDHDNVDHPMESFLSF